MFCTVRLFKNLILAFSKAASEKPILSKIRCGEWKKHALSPLPYEWMFPLYTKPGITHCLSRKPQGGVSYRSELVLVELKSAGAAALKITHSYWTLLLWEVFWYNPLREYILSLRHCSDSRIRGFSKFSQILKGISISLIESPALHVNSLIMSAWCERCSSLPWSWRFNIFNIFPNILLR